MGRIRKWTATEDALFERRWAEGVQLKVIAAELNRTPGALLNRRKLTELPARHGSELTVHVPVRVGVPKAAYDALTTEALAAGVSVPTALRRRLLRSLAEHLPE